MWKIWALASCLLEKPCKQRCQGAAKSAHIPSPLPAPPVPAPPTQDELAKRAKKAEKNKKYRLRKQEKDQKKKKEEEEAKRAAEAKSAQDTHTVTSESSTEEHSPRKTPMAARSSRVLGGLAKKSLFQSLTEISD